MHTDEQQVNDARFLLLLKTDSNNGKKKKQIPISTAPLFYSEAERVRHEYYREKKNMQCKRRDKSSSNTRSKN